ncbi:hypothetical protein [Ekhidna sp. To15]|uniref:hypothetical protein n=1 Tax=Ekhidna sp. To15 TaxID=3395267 RepID=UPI003F526E20
MIYRLRHFENNMQIVSSLGWIMVIVGVITLFVGPIPGGLIFILLGAGLIWLQLRGKRIMVDTTSRTVKSGREITSIDNPSQVFMKEVRVSQTVNSRGSSANVKMYFYKAYIQDGDNNILISCNRNDQRDMEALKRIANDLKIPFEKNY